MVFPKAQRRIDPINRRFANPGKPFMGIYLVVMMGKVDFDFAVIHRDY